MDELSAAFDAACRRFDGSNFAQLDEVDQVLVTIWGLEAEVNNGGFDQYYFNGAGDQAFFAPKALHAIGANTMAEIVTSANAVFGLEGPSADGAVRQAQLFIVAPPDSVELGPWEDLDRAFSEYPDDIAVLLMAFLRARNQSAPR